jgi:hypothetical protein
VHTQLDSSVYNQRNGTLWPHCPDVVINKACVHVVVVVELHAVEKFDGFRLRRAVCSPCNRCCIQWPPQKVATPKQGSELTGHKLRLPCTSSQV